MQRNMLGKKCGLSWRLSFIVHHSSLIVLLLFCSPVWGQPSLSASSLNSGGGNIASGSIYSMNTTLGQSGVVGFSEWNAAKYRIAWGFQPPMEAGTDAPRIISATVSDANDNGIIGPGDHIVLTLDRGVRVTTPVLRASHFFLPVVGDSLGSPNFSVRVNSYNSQQIVLRFGSSAVHLVTTGTFSMSKLTPNSPSGIDFATSLPIGSVVSLDGVPAVDGGMLGVNDSGVDIELSLVRQRGNVGPPGGVVRVKPSPDATYRYHEIDFPAGALKTTMTVELRPPVENLGVIGAVQIKSSAPSTTFTIPVHLRLQYRPLGDIDRERGLVESNMRAHQMVENPKGRFAYAQVPGTPLWPAGAPPESPPDATVKLDSATTRQVGVDVKNLNPCGSLGTVGIFAGLPIETVDERTIYIKPGGGAGIIRGAGSVVLAPGSRGAYTLHKIEIPNYVTTSVTDPQRLVMKMRTATLAERWPQGGGQPFPAQSGAIFTVTVTNASNQPIRFTSPVHLTVQFQDRSNPALTDVVYFNGQLGRPANMRLAYDRLDGDEVDFALANIEPQTVNLVQGTVTVQNLIGLTGTDGRGTFGAVAVDIPVTPADHWPLYR